MSGHSKWANIKHKKAKQDIKKAKIFTKIGKEIMIAIKLGGIDSDGNSRLKLALQNARSNNMPNDNINKIIKRASGENNMKNYEELTYEGYGIDGVAIIVDVLTNNKNRIAGELRYIFEKNGGNLAENGSVSWMFKKRGKINIFLNNKETDELILKLIEWGAEDIEKEKSELNIITSTDNFYNIKKNIDNEKIIINEATITKIPNNIIKINELNKAKKLIKLIESLEENDDVQNIYSNFDFSNEIIGKI